MRIPSLILAAGLALAPVAAVAQEAPLEPTRYDRALAAGYKALFLCSAMANSEAVGWRRSAEDVHAWELTGIQQPLDGIVRDLPYRIERNGGGVISHVAVDWADDAPPRIARHRPGAGCSVWPIGSAEPDSDASSASANDGIIVGHLRDATTVRPVLEAAFDGTYGDGARSTAVLVMADGAYLGGRFAEGFSPYTPQRTWSVAKSVAATIIGAAVQRGEAGVTASAGLGLGEDDPRRAITIDHALRMASGRYSDTPGNRTDPIYWGGATVDERAQTWPMLHEPGTVYRYANNDTLAAVQAIEATFAGVSPSDVLAAIGMEHAIAETDWQGNYVLSSQVWASALDLAMLGQLYLDDGVASDGTRILPEGWARYVSTPTGPQPEGTDWGYGAGWWTFARPEGNAFDGVPDDAFAARGNRGQYVVVVPSRDVVIVRRGEDPVGSGFDIAAFTRDVLATLE